MATLEEARAEAGSAIGHIERIVEEVQEAGGSPQDAYELAESILLGILVLTSRPDAYEQVIQTTSERLKDYVKQLHERGFPDEDGKWPTN